MRGGKRPGAGRHPVPLTEKKTKPNHTVRCTNEEYAAIKEFLAQRRSKKAPAEGEKLKEQYMMIHQLS